MTEMETDVMATKAHWDRYADFLRERDEMANRDWLSMRDQVRGSATEVNRLEVMAGAAGRIPDWRKELRPACSWGSKLASVPCLC